MAHATLSPFESRWLAEALRRRAQARGPLDDVAAREAARRTPGSAEVRVLAWAAAQGETVGELAALRTWAGRVRLVGAVLALLAFIGGVGAALTAAGDGGRPVNVVWTLGGLLGVHLVMLVLWCAGFLLPGGSSGVFAGWWERIARWLAARDAEVATAFAGLHHRNGLTRWWLGKVTHGFWSAALAGAVVGLLITFLLRGHSFTWETTLLPPGFFVHFVEIAGWLPERLGFVTPDTASVAASGTPLVDEAVRRAWASWLVGCVVVYGLVPRLLLWLMCGWSLARGRATLRLDLSAPGFAALVQALAPASERIGVTDAAPERIESAQVEGALAVRQEAVLVGLELRGDLTWPPVLPGAVQDAGIVDGREQRARVQAMLANAPTRRLLVACDPRLSPDRGSLGWIAELSRHAGASRIWLTGQASEERLQRWRESLAGIGLGEESVMLDADAALAWLGGETHG